MDPYNLARFREAQAGVYETACDELRAGRKRTHWMWFIFPQLRGLGASQTSRFYGLASRAEAEAYLGDGELGPRLVTSFDLAMSHKAMTAHEIFGSPDDLKLRSSATLFTAVAGGAGPFAAALDQFFGGEADGRTLALLRDPG